MFVHSREAFKRSPQPLSMVLKHAKPASRSFSGVLRCWNVVLLSLIVMYSNPVSLPLSMGLKRSYPASVFLRGALRTIRWHAVWLKRGRQRACTPHSTARPLKSNSDFVIMSLWLECMNFPLDGRWGKCIQIPIWHGRARFCPAPPCVICCLSLTVLTVPYYSMLMKMKLKADAGGWGLYQLEHHTWSYYSWWLHLKWKETWNSSNKSHPFFFYFICFFGVSYC